MCKQDWVREKARVRPVAGVIANMHLLEDRFPVQLAGERTLCTLAEVAGAPPLIFASAADRIDRGALIIDALLEVVDGVLLIGACANNHPGQFDNKPHPAQERSDESRDALALIEVCDARGAPIFRCLQPSRDERRFRQLIAPRDPPVAGLRLRGPGENGYLYEISKMTRRSGCEAWDIADD
jgi:hypothetical protein